MPSANRIDVHQHFIPPFWSAELSQHGGYPGGWPMPKWSAEEAIDFMDAQEIAKGILSLAPPSITGWNGVGKNAMARRVNEYAADLLEKKPGRFGHFATLPLPDVEGAIAEANYALEKLDADGVVLFSNYDGVYLGDRGLSPLWEALNHLSATVLIHPILPKIAEISGVPRPVVDYPFDTSRTAVHMVLSGVMDRYRDMKVILGHGGGFVPYAAYRFTELSSAVSPEGPTSGELLAQFKRFYFDTALSSSPAALPSLLAFAEQGHVLYGSDFPYAPANVAASFTAVLDSHAELLPEQRLAINHGNASELFYRMKA